MGWRKNDISTFVWKANFGLLFCWITECFVWSLGQHLWTILKLVKTTYTDRYMYLFYSVLRTGHTLVALICRWNSLLQVEIKQSTEKVSSNITKYNMCRFPENMVILEASYIRNRVSEFQSPICCLLEDFFIYPLGMLSTLINICLVNVSWLV